jgi:tripartite-type tricarboxylate transporter receptor subunit TctC
MASSAILGLLLAASHTATTWAVDAYPAQTIEVIVPFGSGGGADAMGRQFARLAEAKLGVSVIVLNVAGASGSSGVEQLAKSTPDGYRIGQVIALTVTAWAAGVGKPHLKDLDYLALMQNSPSMLFVSKASPFRTFEEFLVHARAEPGTLDVATSGNGTPDDITVRYLNSVGIKLVDVPFSKPGDRYSQTIGGHVDVLYEEPGDVAGFLQSGDLRPLVVFDHKRHPAFPDVPASTEFDLQISDLPNFRALAVPVGVPPEHKARLVAVANEILVSDEWRAFCAQTYSCVEPMAPEQVQRLVVSTYEKAKDYLQRFAAAQ